MQWQCLQPSCLAPEMLHTLEACHERVTSLACRAGMRQAAAWPQLASLECTHNDCSAMDSSLTLLPAATRLDLSNNNFVAVQARPLLRSRPSSVFVPTSPVYSSRSTDFASFRAQLRRLVAQIM